MILTSAGFFRCQEICNERPQEARYCRKGISDTHQNPSVPATNQDLTLLFFSPPFNPL